MNDNFSYLFSVHFQNGELGNSFAESLDVCMAKQANDNTSLLLTFSEDNVYDGNVIEGNSSKKLMRTFIGIRKKASEEVIQIYVDVLLTIFKRLFILPQVKLVEVDECNLVSHHHNSFSKQNVCSYYHMSSESARRILFKDFGGKKAIKVLDRREKMKVNVDTVKDQLDKSLLGFS